MIFSVILLLPSIQCQKSKSRKNLSKSCIFNFSSLFVRNGGNDFVENSPQGYSKVGFYKDV